MLYICIYYQAALPCPSRETGGRGGERERYAETKQNEHTLCYHRGAKFPVQEQGQVLLMSIGVRIAESREDRGDQGTANAHAMGIVLERRRKKHNYTCFNFRQASFIKPLMAEQQRHVSCVGDGRN